LLEDHDDQISDARAIGFIVGAHYSTTAEEMVKALYACARSHGYGEGEDLGDDFNKGC